MAVHDYSPQAALDLLMKKVSERDRVLGERIQQVVNAGKDVKETEPKRGRRKHSRSYRKTVPYTYEEAIEVSLAALRAYFVEQPLFLNSCLDEMAAIANEKSAAFGWSLYEEVELQGDEGTRTIEKLVEIELRTETQISMASEDEDIVMIKRTDGRAIEEQKGNLERLRSLMDFGGSHGDAY